MRRAVFFDVENASRVGHITAILAALHLPDGGHARVFAIGNWRVVSQETAHVLAHAGATLIHSAPDFGVKDWSDLRIAVEAGRWLGEARADDVLEIVSDDQAFDAVGDVAAGLGVVFRRVSPRRLRQPPQPAARRPRSRSRPGQSGRISRVAEGASRS